jgi:hypothetical protein
MMAERELRALETVLDRQMDKGQQMKRSEHASHIFYHLLCLPQTSTSESGNEEAGKPWIVSQYFHDEERQKLIRRFDNL